MIKNTLIPQGFKVGFLGGGQLARMMALECHKMGFTPVVFCSSPEEPAAQVCPHTLIGDFNDLQRLEEFFNFCNVVTFESEFLDCQVLRQVEKNTQINIYPSLDSMSLLQDRLTQKHALIDNNIATSPFIGARSLTDIRDAQKYLGGQLVLKKRRNGYDGNGTFFINRQTTKQQIKEIFSKSDSALIAEIKIKFKRELAIIVARDQFGTIEFYPLVESHQKEARCDWVMGPLKHQGIKKLKKGIEQFLTTINYVGVIGFELFDTGKELLVNEIAPRVHNSGHYTQGVFFPNQFLNHVLAVTGQKIIKPETESKGFAMANLIGDSQKLIKWRISLNSDLHLYGKKENRKGRKMGHINTQSSSPKRALKKALNQRKRIAL